MKSDEVRKQRQTDAPCSVICVVSDNTDTLAESTSTTDESQKLYMSRTETLLSWACDIGFSKSQCESLPRFCAKVIAYLHLNQYEFCPREGPQRGIAGALRSAHRANKVHGRLYELLDKHAHNTFVLRIGIVTVTNCG